MRFCRVSLGQGRRKIMRAGGTLILLVALGGCSGDAFSSAGTRARADAAGESGVHYTGGATAGGRTGLRDGGPSGGTSGGGAVGSGGTPMGGAVGNGGLPSIDGSAACAPPQCPTTLQDGSACTPCCTGGVCGCEGLVSTVCLPTGVCTPRGSSSFCFTSEDLFACPGAPPPSSACRSVSPQGAHFFCCPAAGTGTGGAPGAGGAGGSCSQIGGACTWTRAGSCCAGGICLLNSTTCQPCFPSGSSCGGQAMLCCSKTCSTDGICVGLAPGAGGSATGGTASTGGMPNTGGTPATGGTAASGGAQSTGGGAPTGGSPGTGGLAGTGGTICVPQPCANDGVTCGSIPDGCGGLSTCLYQCASAQTCNATNRCQCSAAAQCPATLQDGSSYTPCCTSTGTCGNSGFAFCSPVNVCTARGTSAICSNSATSYLYTCPGVPAPDPGCKAGSFQGTAYFCCPKASYP
jgi:hypothetical protein